MLLAYQRKSRCFTTILWRKYGYTNDCMTRNAVEGWSSQLGRKRTQLWTANNKQEAFHLTPRKKQVALQDLALCETQHATFTASGNWAMPSVQSSYKRQSQHLKYMFTMHITTLNTALALESSQKEKKIREGTQSMCHTC